MSAIDTAVALFNSQVQKFVLDIPDQVEDLVRTISLEAVSRITKKNPVDTGRSRANWITSLDGPFDYSISGWEGRDPVAEATAALGVKMPEFPVVTIFNNVHYVGYLEQGWSRQAPSGMVAVTLAELQAAFGP